MFGSVSGSIRNYAYTVSVRDCKYFMLTKGSIKSLSRRVFEHLVCNPFRCQTTLFVSSSTMVVTVILIFVLQNL